MPKFRLVLESDWLEDMVAIAGLADEKGVYFSGINRIEVERSKKRKNVDVKKFRKRNIVRPIIEYMKTKKEVNGKDLHPIMKKNGFSEGSSSSTLSQMVSFGLAERIGKGTYRLTEAGKNDPI